jgi:hypothetical protein
MMHFPAQVQKGMVMPKFTWIGRDKMQGESNDEGVMHSGSPKWLGANGQFKDQICNFM